MIAANKSIISTMVAIAESHDNFAWVDVNGSNKRFDFGLTDGVLRIQFKDVVIKVNPDNSNITSIFLDSDPDVDYIEDIKSGNDKHGILSILTNLCHRDCKIVG